MTDAVLAPDTPDGEGASGPPDAAHSTVANDPLLGIEATLRAEPTSFGFFQAVRLLRQIRPDRAAVGRFVNPADEVVRFSVPSLISFPPSEIRSLEIPEDGVARMTVNFLGLTGPQGLLPYHYTLLIADRKRVRDAAIGDFFDLFHHRLLSLFYRAWEKYRFGVPYEREEDDALTVHLRDLIGIGLEHDRPGLPLPGDGLLHYAGLLGPQPRGAQALRQLLADHFDVPVSVEQFVGRWYPLPRSDQCELGDEESMSNQLGLGAVAGDEIWDAQTCVRLRVGPLSRQRYNSFLPGGRDHDTLRSLARFFSHDQFDFELQLVLAREDVPGLVLGEVGAQPLGWSTWLRTREFERDADETILTL